MVGPHSAMCSVLSVGWGAKGPLSLDVDEHHTYLEDKGI